MTSRTKTSRYTKTRFVSSRASTEICRQLCDLFLQTAQIRADRLVLVWFARKREESKPRWHWHEKTGAYFRRGVFCGVRDQASGGFLKFNLCCIYFNQMIRNPFERQMPHLWICGDDSELIRAAEKPAKQRINQNTGMNTARTDGGLAADMQGTEDSWGRWALMILNLLLRGLTVWEPKLFKATCKLILVPLRTSKVTVEFIATF